MPNPIISPLDKPYPFEEMGALPGGGQLNTNLAQRMAPPIIPNVTQLGPEKMRAILQAMQRGQMPDSGEMEHENNGGDSMMDQDMENMSPQDIMSCVGKLALQAASISPDFPNVLCTLIKTIQKGVMSVNGQQQPGADQGYDQTAPQPPPMMPPPSLPMGGLPPPAAPMGGPTMTSPGMGIFNG